MRVWRASALVPWVALIVLVVPTSSLAKKYEPGGFTRKKLKVDGDVVELSDPTETGTVQLPETNLEAEVSFRRMEGPTGAMCALDASISYIDLTDEVQVDARIDSTDCAAAHGEYAIRVISETESGETRTDSYTESWQRGTAGTLKLTHFYPVKGNLRRVRIRSREESRCICDPPHEDR